MTISINTSNPAQIAAQDLTSNPTSQPAAGVQADAPAVVDDPAASAPSDQITAHAGLVALASARLVQPRLSARAVNEVNLDVHHVRAW